MLVVRNGTVVWLMGMQVLSAECASSRSSRIYVESHWAVISAPNMSGSAKAPEVPDLPIACEVHQSPDDDVRERRKRTCDLVS